MQACACVPASVSACSGNAPGIGPGGKLKHVAFGIYLLPFGTDRSAKRVLACTPGARKCLKHRLCCRFTLFLSYNWTKTHRQGGQRAAWVCVACKYLSPPPPVFLQGARGVYCHPSCPPSTLPNHAQALTTDPSSSSSSLPPSYGAGVPLLPLPYSSSSSSSPYELRIRARTLAAAPSFGARGRSSSCAQRVHAFQQMNNPRACVHVYVPEAGYRVCNLHVCVLRVCRRARSWLCPFGELFEQPHRTGSQASRVCGGGQNGMVARMGQGSLRDGGVARMGQGRKTSRMGGCAKGRLGRRTQQQGIRKPGGTAECADAQRASTHARACIIHNTHART